VTRDEHIRADQPLRQGHGRDDRVLSAARARDPRPVRVAGRIRSSGSEATPTRNSTADPATRAFRSASSIIAGERSTPTTSAPDSANRTDREPVPQPRSATLAAPGGIQRARRPAHAARTCGSARPWSGSSSNVRA
jgi:hypothetical protein